MKEIVDKIEGDFTTPGEPLVISGMINGNLFVDNGATIELNGMVIKNVIVRSGQLRLNGTVVGDVTNVGGTLRILGTINGTLLKHGGNTFVDRNAKIGRIA